MFSYISILLVSLISISFIDSSVAQVQPCNLAQLAGNDQLFTITANNDTIYPGDIENVHWNRPQGAHVRRIRANVSIIDTILDTLYTPVNVTGVPVEFSNSDSNSDLEGDIGILLPSDIPVGENYAIRLTLRSRGSLCYLDTNNFIVTSNSGIPSDCTPGSMMCVSDLSGFQQCIETDGNATSFAYGDIIYCAATTICNQLSENTISCSIPPIIDQCTLGTYECVDPDSSSLCILDPTTNTTVWGDAVPCENGYSCSATTNTCQPDTVDQCTLGTSECVDPDSSSLCILDPTTNTTVWGDAVPCENGYSCSATTNTCQPDTVDQCTLGTSECVSENSNRQCVLNSDTNTTIWTNATDCSAGTTCNNDTGLCTFTGPGTSGCTPHAQICLSETEFDECIHNDQGFWTFGGVTLNCPTGSVCTPYINNTINCVPSVVLRKRISRIQVGHIL